MDDHVRKSSFKNWFKNQNRSLVVFLITFLINNIIIWTIVGISWVVYVEIPIIILGIFFAPIFGGVCRGIYSTMSTKRFWLITSIWAIILAFGLVPLVGMLSDASFSEYGADLIIGLVTAGVMILSSFVGFGIRKRRELS